MELDSQNRKDAGVIALVRHGSYNTETGELDEKGREDARAVASSLREKEEWTRIVTSPSRRTAETGRIIANEIGIPMETDERWAEMSKHRERLAELTPGTIYVTHLPILRGLVAGWEPNVGEAKVIRLDEISY
ncbi:MAG: histidine phosphatase family protein [Patescibacteria group bacterium]|jgi:phosphohistidine phosphatase SixA